MSNDIISQADNAQRAENIACIRKYVDARTPAERGSRWELYVDDCTSGAVAGAPLEGKEIARKCTLWNLVHFPNYVFNDNIIFQSTDPDYFCIMSKGTGGINYPAYGPQKQYDNVFFHAIRMRDGRMKDYFEYSNLLKMYQTLGIEIPALDSPAGWPEHLTESIKRGDSRWEAEVIAALHVLGRAPLPDFADKSAMASEWEAHHRRFHSALVSACGSEWLLRFWNQLVDHSQRYRKIRLAGPLVARDVQAEHQAIVDAVLRRDAVAAVALMERHLSDTEEAARTALQQAR